MLPGGHVAVPPIRIGRHILCCPCLLIGAHCGGGEKDTGLRAVEGVLCQIGSWQLRCLFYKKTHVVKQNDPPKKVSHIINLITHYVTPTYTPIASISL